MLHHLRQGQRVAPDPDPVIAVYPARAGLHPDPIKRAGKAVPPDPDPDLGRRRIERVVRRTRRGWRTTSIARVRRRRRERLKPSRGATVSLNRGAAQRRRKGMTKSVCVCFFKKIRMYKKHLT